MKKNFLAAFAFLFLSTLGFGQAFTVITAAGLNVDNGSGTAVHPPAGSNLCFLGVNNKGAQITYTPSGGSPTTGPVCQTLNSSGNLTGSLQVANPALATPVGLLYTITVTNGGTTYLSVPTVSLTGASFNFTGFSLPGNGTATGVGFPHVLCNAGARWTSTTLPPGQESEVCEVILGIGGWQAYPLSNYCPAGTSFQQPQIVGAAFCLPPVLAGIGAPTGACIKSSTYLQQDAPGTLYGCIAGAWVLMNGGGGGGSGLTSFNGRTTPAATLQSSDVTTILANAPFGLFGTGGILFDSGSGIFQASPAWKISAGVGPLMGQGDIDLSNGTSDTIELHNTNGSAFFASGAFTISSAGVAAMAAGSTVNGSPICTTANGACPGGGGSSFYQTAKNNTTALTARPNFSFQTATGIVGSDDSGNAATNLSLVNVPNSSLANSSVTVNCSGSCTGGGSVALGGSLTLVVTGGGGGGVTPATAFQQTYYNASTTVFGDTLATTDGNGNQKMVSVSPVTNAVPLNVNGALTANALNYQRCNNSSGTSCFGTTNPYNFNAYTTQRPPNGIFAVPFNFFYGSYSGGENANNILYNTGVMDIEYNVYTPGQGGNGITYNTLQTAWGDNVLHTGSNLWWASGRGQDESFQPNRVFTAPLNSDAGGNITVGAVTAEGHVPVFISTFGGYNTKNWGEQNYVVDVTKRQSVGNMIGGGPAGPGNVFQEVIFDTSTTLGASGNTQLTAAVDSQVYSGTCPTHTPTGQVYPIVGPNLGSGIGDAWVTLLNGTGQQGINGNYNPTSGALVGYCATVTSTSGMSNGQQIIVSDGVNYVTEFSKIISVVDSTHFTFFAHHNHNSGATVGFGGAVGYGVGLAADERAAGQFDSIGNPQATIFRLLYPVVYSIDNTHVLVDVNAQESNNQPEYKSLANAGITPNRIVAFGTLTVTGGVLTNAPQTDFGDYGVVAIYTTGHRVLPHPILTFGGSSACATNPTFSWRVDRAAYIATLTNGGTGCPSNLSITVNTTFPMPAYIAPIAQVLKMTTINGSTGLPQVDSGNLIFNTMPSAMVSTDEVQQTMPQGRYYADKLSSYGDPIITGSARDGFPPTVHWYGHLAGQARESLIQQTPTNWFLGTFANNWTAVNSYDQSEPTSLVNDYHGLWSGTAYRFPPTVTPGTGIILTDAGDPNAPTTGGYMWSIYCGFLDFSGEDHPCMHGQNAPYGIFAFNFGSSIGSLTVDPANDNQIEYNQTIRANYISAKLGLHVTDSFTGTQDELWAVDNGRWFAGHRSGNDPPTPDLAVESGGFYSGVFQAGFFRGTSPSIFPTPGGGSATCSYKETESTSVGESLLSTVSTTTTCPASLSTNPLFIKPGPEFNPGALTFKIYKDDGTGTFKFLCGGPASDQGCTDSGQALGAVASPSGLTGSVTNFGITNSNYDAATTFINPAVTVASLPPTHVSNWEFQWVLDAGNTTAGTCVGGGTAPASYQLALWDGVNWNCAGTGGGGGGGGLPSSTAPGIILTPATTGTTTYAAQGQVFYSQAADTISSIESECSSICTYIVTVPQTMTLSADHTLSANVNLQFYEGGEWTIAGGHILTIPGNVQGTLSQHFAGSTTIFGASQSIVPVEWFGAVGDGSTDDTTAIQTTLNAVSNGQAQLQAKQYRITSALTITRSRVGIAGTTVGGRNTLFSAPVNQPSEIKIDSASADGITVTGPVGPETGYIAFNRFDHFFISRTTVPSGTAKGLGIIRSTGVTVDWVNSDDSIYDFYFLGASSQDGGGITNSYAHFGYNGVTSTSGTVAGFWLDTTTGVFEGSITFRDDGVFSLLSASVTTYGMAIVGETPADVDTFNFNDASVSYGQAILYSGSPVTDGSQDIQFFDSTHDQCLVECVLVSGVSTAQRGSVVIKGGWFSIKNTATGTPGGTVDIENSKNVLITGILGDDTTGGVPLIYINGSSQIGVVGNELQGNNNTQDVAVWLNNSSGVNVTGNKISTIGIGTYLVDSSGNTVSGNSYTDFNNSIGVIRIEGTSSDNAGYLSNSFSNLGGSELRVVDITGNVTNQIESVTKLTTTSVCASAASPAVCGGAPTGLIEVAAAATTLTVNTTAITANSACQFTYSTENITAPTNINLMIPPYLTSRTAGTSFTITLPVAPATNPILIWFSCIN